MSDSRELASISGKGRVVTAGWEGPPDTRFQRRRQLSSPLYIIHTCTCVYASDSTGSIEFTDNLHAHNTVVSFILCTNHDLETISSSDIRMYVHMYIIDSN